MITPQPPWKNKRIWGITAVFLLIGILGGVGLGLLRREPDPVLDEEELVCEHTDAAQATATALAAAATPAPDLTTSPPSVAPPTSTPTAVPGPGPTITGLETNAADYPAGQIPRYQKLELTFQVDTAAANPQLPYDPAPPPGLEPDLGISVDAHFTPDEWQTVYIQPAFYYQPFETAVHNGQEWLYPTADFAWKVRFAPDAVGEWQVKLVAQDRNGRSETDPLSFTVSESDDPGFIRVSEADARYFEFENGRYFPGLGVNLRLASEAEQLPWLAENGVQLLRTWLPSEFPMFGSAWSQWRPFGAPPLGSEPNARLRYDAAPPFTRAPGDSPLARPGSDFFLWLSHDETVFPGGQQWNFVPCTVWGWNAPRLPVQPQTDYRLRVRFRLHDVTGPRVAGEPFGFVVKTGNWLWSEEDSQRCNYPGTGTLLAASYSQTDQWTTYPDPDYNGWQILDGRFRTGDAYFLDWLYLALENATGGSALVDMVWLEEALGDDQFGPNVLSRPWMAHHRYFDQRNGFAFDRALTQVEELGLYLKLVILEKNDFTLNAFNFDGSMSADLPHQQQQPLFYGNGRETDGKTKTRWLQEAWWRYLQARWGYSPHIHSWELLNEGNPGSVAHYALADAFGAYMQTAFVPTGQAAPHPNQHLVTTSFWNDFPRDRFWASADHPHIDYADIHHYARPDDVRPLADIYEPADYNDAALFSQKLSLALGAQQPGGAGIPVVRGETGWFFPEADLFAQDAAEGIWLRNFLWAGLNSGGLVELYWTGAPTQSHIAGENHDYWPLFRAYANFINTLPLNNGRYQDANPAISTPDLRAWGQQDVTAGRAHLWIQNRQYTWRNVVDGAAETAVSGTVTLANFQPGQPYQVEWWDTSQPNPAQQIVATETVTTDGDGRLTLIVTDLVSDTAVQISPP